MADELVSIIITSYNREKYIALSIESALAITYSNFEILIVDDNSNDKTAQIALGYAEKNSNIRLFINEKNIGQFNNRNKAIKLAKGEYIKFLDSDDLLYPSCISSMMSLFIKYPNAGIAVPIGKTNFPELLSPHDSIYKHYTVSNHLCYGPTAIIYSKTALTKVNFFDASFGILTDTLLNLKIASQFDTVFVPNDLFFWRVHIDQVTTEQQDDVRMIKERNDITNAVLALENLPLNKYEKQQISNNFKKINWVHFIKYFFKLKFKDAFVIKKNTDLKFKELIFSFFK